MAARKVIEHFATRAFRRPATGEEVAALFKLYKVARADGDGFEPAVKLSLSAVLVLARTSSTASSSTRRTPSRARSTRSTTTSWPRG